jgi:hypothetical protein
MVPVAEVVVLVLLAVVGVWWFRRTPLYRAHRRSGVVPGQWSAWTSPRWYGDNPMPQRPELRPQAGLAPRRAGRRPRGRRR